jgi:hypothetical protein
MLFLVCNSYKDCSPCAKLGGESLKRANGGRPAPWPVRLKLVNKKSFTQFAAV